MISDFTYLQKLQLTDDESITLYLSAHPELKALVTIDGEIYYVKDNAKRQFQDLRRAVANSDLRGDGKECQQVMAQAYDGFTRLREEKSSFSFSESSINQQISDLIEMAIDRESNDIHIRAHYESPWIGFRINGYLDVHGPKLLYAEAEQIVRQFFQGRDYGNTGFNPQDACDASFEYISRNGTPHVVRLNSLPEVRGINVAVRIRNPHEVTELESAGYSEKQTTLIRQIMRSNSGLFIFAGPTNSGKSTTTTALINEIPNTRHVLELGDPIEVVLPWVTHVNLDRAGDDAEERIERIFGATVRQDTDVLVLGEIRDQMTAQCAEHMAEQGKFVLSTLHTESVSMAAARLVALGMNEDTLAIPGFWRGVVCQKLIPTLCPGCALDAPLTGKTKAEYDVLMQCSAGDTLRFRNTEGCDKCHQTGIDGRTLVAEVMQIDRKICELLKKRDPWAIVDYLTTQGTETRHDHARMKVLTGLIDPTITEALIDPFTHDNTPTLERLRAV